MSDQGVYGPTWYAATAALSPARPALDLDADADICVIGGGLAGLTVARELARHGQSVVLLEAQRVAWNASGRNTGFVLPGYQLEPDALVGRVGEEHARALWALSVAGVESVRRTIQEIGGAGIEPEETGWLYVDKTGRDARLAGQAELLHALGSNAELWPKERVRDVLRTPHYFGGMFFPNAFAINPLAYSLRLAEAAEAAGVRIYENTAAIEIDPAGVRKRVSTLHARVRAGHIVLAGNVHLGAAMPDVANTLLDISTYVIVTAPLGERLREVVHFRGAVTDTDFADNHYRVVGGDRLMFAGRCTTWHADAQRFVKPLLADLARLFPDLAGATAEYAWSGRAGSAVHLMPQIGELMPGVWLLSGFSGQGLNTTAVGGELIARAIVEGDRTWQMFAPFALVWAGGVAGRAAMQAYYWYDRTRERVQGEIARRREAGRAGVTAPRAAT